MRKIIILCLGFLMAASSYGQRSGGRGGGGFGGGGHGGRGGGGHFPGHVGVFAPAPRSFGLGFGNVLFPGGVRPLTPSFFGADAGFAHRLGGLVAGEPFTGAPSVGPRFGNRFGNFGNQVVLPIPYYVGGGGYYPDVQAPPNVTVVLAPPPPGQNPVVFNQNYMPETARPEVREYPEEPDGSEPNESSSLRSYEAPPPYAIPEPQTARKATPTKRTVPRGSARLKPSQVMEEKATVYLLAFKNGSIQAAYAYWVEGNTLHYVTTQGSHNRATLDLIDKDLSDQLNRERNVEFSLRKTR